MPSIGIPVIGKRVANRVIGYGFPVEIGQFVRPVRVSVTPEPKPGEFSARRVLALILFSLQNVADLVFDADRTNLSDRQAIEPVNNKC